MSKYVTAEEEMFQCNVCELECASRELKHKMKYTMCPRCDSVVYGIGRQYAQVRNS